MTPPVPPVVPERPGNSASRGETHEHEVRTSLTALLSGIALLQVRCRASEDDDLHSVLDVCAENATRLARRLLPPVARDAIPIDAAIADVRDIVRDAVMGASELARDVSAHLALDGGRGPRWIRADGRAMTLAIENILTRLLVAGAEDISIAVRPTGRLVRITLVAHLRPRRAEFSPESAFRDEGTRAVERLIETYGGHLARGEGDGRAFHIRILLPEVPRSRTRTAMRAVR